MGKLSRDKGKVWERELVRIFKPRFGPQVKRGLAQSRFGAQEAPDVQGCQPLWIEAKHGKKPNLRAALRQAEEAMAASGRDGYSIPIAVCKDNRKEPMVVMRLDGFLRLVDSWLAGAQDDGGGGSDHGSDT